MCGRCRERFQPETGLERRCVPCTEKVNATGASRPRQSRPAARRPYVLVPLRNGGASSSPTPSETALSLAARLVPTIAGEFERLAVERDEAIAARKTLERELGAVTARAAVAEQCAREWRQRAEKLEGLQASTEPAIQAEVH